MDKKRTAREIIEEIASTPEEGMKQENPQPVLSDEQPSLQQVSQEDVQKTTPEPQKTVEEKPSEPTEVERIPVKVMGKEGEMVRYSDGRVVYFEDGVPKREFSSLQEAFQKAVASDEKFQQASLLKKQVELKEQELEEKKKTVAEKLIQIAEKQLAGGEEFIKFIKETGYQLTPEQEASILENDESATYKIYLDVVKELKKQKDAIEQELGRIQQEKMQSEVQELLNNEFVKELDTLAGKPVGTGMLVGILSGLAYKFAQEGSNVSIEDVKNVVQQFVTDMNLVIKQYAKNRLDELIDEGDAMNIVEKILKKYPTIEEKIKNDVIASLKNKKEAGIKSAIPTTPETKGVETIEDKKSKVGKDFLMKILRGG